MSSYINSMVVVFCQYLLGPVLGSLRGCAPRRDRRLQRVLPRVGTMMDLQHGRIARRVLLICGCLGVVSGAFMACPPRSREAVRNGRWSVSGSAAAQSALLYSHNQGEASGQGRPLAVEGGTRRAALQKGLQQSVILGAILGGGGRAARADGIDLTELKEVAKENGNEGIAQQLQQAQGELQPQFYLDQIDQAMPIKTMRGVWRIREFRDGEELCKGRLTFRGFVDDPLRGSLEYTGCDDRKGKGKWLLKPARIDKGQIRFSARWKVNFKGGDSLIYRGDVVAGGDSYAKAEASILQGEVLRPVTGVTGNLTERRCGAFEADLIERITDEDKL